MEQSLLSVTVPPPWADLRKWQTLSTCTFLPLTTLHPGMPRALSTNQVRVIHVLKRWSQWNWDSDHARARFRISKSTQFRFYLTWSWRLCRKHPLPQRSGSNRISRFYESHRWELERWWLSKWVHIPVPTEKPGMTVCVHHPSLGVQRQTGPGCLLAGQPHPENFRSVRDLVSKM